MKSFIFLSFLVFHSIDVMASPTLGGAKSCSQIFNSQRGQLPQLPRLFIEDSPMRKEYFLAKSVLENKQYSYFNRTLEEQTQLFESTHVKAVTEMVTLLQKDLELSKIAKRDFVRIAKANIDWSMSIPALDIARYQLHLLKKGIDPLSKPQHLGALFSNFQYPSLVHRTYLKDLIPILKSGVLAPRDVTNVDSNYGGDIGDRRYLYLEAYPKAEEGRLINSKVRSDLFSQYPIVINKMFKKYIYLEIDSSAVDVGGFKHMSGDWLYGQFSNKESVRGTYELAAFLNAIDKTPGTMLGYQPRTEVLLTKPISVKDFLRGINVHPDQVEAVKQYLRENGVDEMLIALVN